MANIGSLVLTLQARTDSLERQLNRANGFIRKLQRETQGIGTAAGRAERVTTRAFTRMSFGARGLSTRILATSRAMRSLAVAGAALLAGGFVVRTIEAADAIGKLADRLDITVEGMQELEFAASQSGVQLNVFQLGLQRILRRAQDAVEGNKQLRQAFRNVGLSLEDLQRLSNEEIFTRAITGAAELENGLVAIQKIADTEGVALLQLGQQGAEGIVQLREAARSLGIVLDESLIRKAAEANDQLDRTRRIITTRVTAAILELTPAITDLGKSFARIVERIADTNAVVQDLTSQEVALANFARGTAQVITTLAQSFVFLTEKIGDAAAGLFNFITRKPTRPEIVGLNPNLAPLAPPTPPPRGRISIRIDESQTSRAAEAAAEIERLRAKLEREDIRAINAANAKRLLAPIKDLARFNTELKDSLGASGQIVTTFFDSLESSVSQAAIGVARGTQTMSQAFANFAQSLATSLLSSAVSQSIDVLQTLALSAIRGGITGGIGGGAGATAAPFALAGGGVVRGPTLALLGENPANNPEVVLNRQQFGALQRPQITVINVADATQAEQIARDEEALGRHVIMNTISQDLQRGNASPLVRQMRQVIGR